MTNLGRITHDEGNLGTMKTDQGTIKVDLSMAQVDLGMANVDLGKISNGQGGGNCISLD